jgi:hypothetical protein
VKFHSRIRQQFHFVIPPFVILPTTVIDAYDQEVVGYSFSRFCRTDEFPSAVNQALETLFPMGSQAVA